MAAEVHALVPRRGDFRVHIALAASQDTPSTQELLRQLRDMLFVIGGAAVHLKSERGDRDSGLVENLLEAVRRASDSARVLADRVAEHTSC